MTKRRLIGYATTDSNGVATLTYTGKGVGEMDIIAETGGEMVSVDIGTSSNYTDTIWNNWNSSAIINRATNYTSITKASSDTAGSWQISNAPFTDNNLKIEFDVYVDSSVQTDTFFQLRNQSYNVLGNITLNNMSLATNTWHHIILRFDGTNCYISNTTNSNTSNRANLTVTKIMFRCDTNTNEVRYKNFFIYRGSSSLVSEPKTIGDMLFYDNATSSSHNDNWEYIETKFTRQTDGTEYSNSNWNVAHIKINDSNNIPFSNGVCVDLWVAAISAYVELRPRLIKQLQWCACQH